jgi:hypothetical protein
MRLRELPWREGAALADRQTSEVSGAMPPKEPNFRPNHALAAAGRCWRIVAFCSTVQSTRSEHPGDRVFVRAVRQVGTA